MTQTRQVAIRGHKTRGREVIQSLTNLGGINYYNYEGDVEENCYYIEDSSRYINWGNDYKAFSYVYDIFTLEEFLENIFKDKK